MIDLILLRLIKYRKQFHRLYGILPKANLTAQTQALVEDFRKYFEAYPSHNKIDLLTFLPKFRNWHPGMSDELFNQYTAILRNIQPDPDADQERNLLSDLASIELMTAAANLANEFDEGDLPDPYTALGTVMDAYRKRRGLKAQTWNDTPIEELLKDEFDDSGVRWRLDCLNMSMRPLRPGDFGIIAGRPDKGKTSFISSEITFMAPQLPEDRNIIWLNNEGKSDRIKVRYYQSALNLNMDEMKALANADKLVPAFIKAIGGRLDKIRVFDIHGYTTGMVETILEENNPGIVVYDMIDKIRGFGEAARTDLQLEQMYDWARERSVKYDCVGLATSQISNEGDGMMFPTLGMLKDSKTGKQGACDFLLMIGASNDEAFTNSRFLGLPKNKLRRVGAPGDPRAEVRFDGDRSRYSDVPIGG